MTRFKTTLNVTRFLPALISNNSFCVTFQGMIFSSNLMLCSLTMQKALVVMVQNVHYTIYLLLNNNALSMKGGHNMIELGIAVLIGAFIGWNLPQPAWAAKFQAWVVEQYNKLKAKLSS